MVDGFTNKNLTVGFFVVLSGYLIFGNSTPPSVSGILPDHHLPVYPPQNESNPYSTYGRGKIHHLQTATFHKGIC